MALDLAQLDYAGNMLRAWNQEIKAALAEMGIHPGTVTPELARAAYEAQVNYERLREAYTFAYRSMFGAVPSGLSSSRLGLLVAPIALSNPITALVLVVGAIAVGGVAWQAMQIFRDAFTVWRERLRASQGTLLPPIGSGFGDWISDNLIWLSAAGLGFVVLLRR